jgi:hypothetical protein
MTTKLLPFRIKQNLNTLQLYLFFYISAEIFSRINIEFQTEKKPPSYVKKFTISYTVELAPTP